MAWVDPKTIRSQARPNRRDPDGTYRRRLGCEVGSGRRMSMATSYSIEVAASPEMATTVRIFAAESARSFGCDEGQIDDIRLIVTELLANAIQTGGRRLRLTLSVDDEGWRIHAEGAGSLATGSKEQPVDRRALVGSLASVHERDGHIELRGSSTNGDR